MPHAGVSTPLEHVQVPDQIAVGVDVGVLQGVAHTRLGCEVDHPVEAVLGEQRGHALAIGQVQRDESHVVAARQIIEAGLLERDIVIRVEIVDPDDLVALPGEPPGHGMADEPGQAGD